MEIYVKPCNCIGKIGIHIPQWTWVSFGQVMKLVIKIAENADLTEKDVMNRSRYEWGCWAKQAIQKGARLAHKATQNRVIQSVLDTEWAGSQQVLPQPKDAADAELNTWKPTWNTHKMDDDIQTICQGIKLQDLPPITAENWI